jgi:ferric-dicitrate binding protein FerR (iron transport regulator)
MTDNQDSHWEKIAGKLHGELDAGEEMEFNKLMSEPIHRKEFEKAHRIRLDLGAVESMPVDAKTGSWERVEAGLSWHKRYHVTVLLKYAAIVAVAFLSGILLRTYSPIDKSPHFSEIRVPYGQMSQITLSDGTEVWLNSGTTMSYPDKFGEKSRSVTISGEAYFKVAKMANKPFTINSTDLKIEVLGTAFNFSAYQEDSYSSVTLVEGKVAILDNKGVTLAKMQPGQMARKLKSSDKLNIQTVKTASYSAWTDGKIFFDDERLDQIAYKLERWFNVEITFGDPSLKSKRFTGTILKNKPVDQIMQALELLAPISFKHEINASQRDKITIFKRT